MGLLDDAIREHLDLKRRRGADPTEIERAEREALGPVRREATSSAALSESEPRAVVAFPDDPVAPDEEFDFGVGRDDLDEDHPTTVVPVSAAEEDSSVTGSIAAPHYSDPDFDDFTAAKPPVTDFDLPAEGPIAAMPEPVNEPKHKRRGLFGRRHHDEDDGFGGGGPLPAELPDDDPFADDFEPEAPRVAAAGEAVGRAQPIPRDDESEPPPRPAPPTLKITPDAELGHTVEYDVEEAFADEDGDDEDILEETPDFLADTPDHDRLWFEQKPPPDFDFDR